MTARECWVAATLALLGCGKGSSKAKQDDPPIARAVDAATVRPPDAAPQPLGLGNLAGKLVTHDGDSDLLDAPPAAVVVIDADGTLRVVASGGAWEALIAADPAAAPAVTLADLATAVLDVLQAAGGPAAAQAATLRAELDEARAELGEVPDPTIGDFGGGDEEEELAFTYGDVEGRQAGEATPLLVAHPEAPAVTVTAVLDAVGGALLVESGGQLGLIRTYFPWENGGWGGATLPEIPGIEEDEEAASIDAQLGREAIAFDLGSNNFAFVDGKQPDPAALARILADAPGAKAQGGDVAPIDLLVSRAPRISSTRWWCSSGTPIARSVWASARGRCPARGAATAIRCRRRLGRGRTPSMAASRCREASAWTWSDASSGATATS